MCGVVPGSQCVPGVDRSARARGDGEALGGLGPVAQDLVTDTGAKEEIESLQKMLTRLEVDKLDKILELIGNPGKA
jgi:hypothetical protein